MKRKRKQDPLMENIIKVQEAFNGHRQSEGNDSSGATRVAGPSSTSTIGPLALGNGEDEGTDPCLTVPDSAEAVVGWRWWNSFDYVRYQAGAVMTTGDPQPTGSLHSRQSWPWGAPLRARCEAGDLLYTGTRSNRETHPSPHEPCDCGIYAFNEFSQYGGDVFGEVSLWGKVIVQERGYRAEFAYPKRLWVSLPSNCPQPPSDIKEMLQVNGMNHLPLDDIEAMHQEFYKTNLEDWLRRTVPVIENARLLANNYKVPVLLYDPVNPFDQSQWQEEAA